MKQDLHDVLIIGAGVIGCAIARELSRFSLRIAVLEKENDVANGTSKANSAIVHAGYDAVPGTWKAKMNLAGNAMFDTLCQDLEVPFRRNGSLVLCFNKNDRSKLEELLYRGNQNGVPNLKILDREEILEMEPHIGKNVEAALYAPSGGIVCPYELTIALSENATANGVAFYCKQKVLKIETTNFGFRVHTQNKSYDTRVLVNAAGVFADEINNMLSSQKFDIIPRAGQYCLLDKAAGNIVSHTLFQLPGPMGKGVLVTPTVDGNLLLGPTAEDIDDKNNTATTAKQFERILNTVGLTLKEVPWRETITSFTGLRAHNETDDFIIGESPDVPNLFQAAGIESPGLTGAPAIGQYLSEIIAQALQAEKKLDFVPKRKAIEKFREMDFETASKKIKENPAFGRIVCRCEKVTEAEIVEAIHRSPAADLDGIKRRTRAGMGRCQGGFCSPRVAQLISRERQIPITQVTKNGGDSYILIGKNKEIEERV